MESQKYIIVLLVIIYIILSNYAQRFQYETRNFSMLFSGGVSNPNIQQKVTPNFIGIIVIINFFLLLGIGLLLWYNKNWWVALITIIILFFSSSILQMIFPFPSKRSIYSQMLKESMKGNKIENLQIVNKLMEILK